METTMPATAVRSPAPGEIPDAITSPVSNGTAGEARRVSARSSGPAATSGETRGGRFRRKAHRTRLYGYAVGAVVLVAFLIALAATNTARVKVSWVFGTSHVSVVWLVLFTAILGWLLGLIATAAFHWRTRAPRRRDGATS